MLREAVTLTGSDEAKSLYQIRRAYVDLGRILSNSGRKDEAEGFLTKARDLQNKTMEQSQQSIASIARDRGDGSAAAVVPLSRRLENEAAPAIQSSVDPFARIDAATLAKSKLTPEQRNRAEVRENELRSVLGLAFSDLATSEALRGEYAKALGYYQQAEHWDAAVPALEKNLGQSAFRSGNYAEAIHGLGKALEQKPDSAPLRAMLGMSYFAMDKYVEAARTFAPLGESGRTDAETGYAWAASLAHVYITNDSTPKHLYENEGNGKFKDIGLESGTAVSDDGTEQASMGIAVGDYNHTGHPSLFVTNFSDENDVLYRNEGNWNFKEVSYSSGVALPSLPWVKWGTAFVDLDNDGWLDLIAVSGRVYPQVDSLPSGGGYREPKLLHLNQQDGIFCDASDLAGAAMKQHRVSRGLAVGDLFNDGNIDVVVGDIDGAPMVLRNRGISGRHWVSFELAGVKSNRLSLKARISIVAGGMTQTDEIHSGGSYLSQNDLRVHFGLGSADKIQRVTIHWPSGKIEILNDVAADKFYSVLEGQGIVPSERVLSGAQKH